MSHFAVPPSISVVLPTYLRPDSLSRVLLALSVQEDPGADWELVVVDNDPQGSALSIVDALRSSFLVPVRVFVEPRSGAAHARNLGMTEARCEIIAFIDDDVIPESDWLLKLVDPILQGRCEGTGGRVVLDPAVDRPEWFDEEGIGGYLSRFDLGSAMLSIVPDGYVLTANAAFLAEPLRKTGGFDVRLGPRGNTQLVCDDNLITRRFIAAGSNVLYVPSAVVIHDLPRARLSPQYLIRRAYTQGRSDWRLMHVLDNLTRFWGLRLAVDWLHVELPRRRDEGLRHPEVAFHAMTDLARSAGVLHELASYALSHRRFMLE